MSQAGKIKLVIERILGMILDNPAQVEILIGERTDLFTIYPHKDEIGRVMGAKGRNIQAIRNIIKAINHGDGSKRTIVVCDGTD